MYLNEPSVAKTEAADRLNLLHSSRTSYSIENLVNCLYPCPDMLHFMMVTKKLLLSDIEIKHWITLLNQY